MRVRVRANMARTDTAQSYRGLYLLMALLGVMLLMRDAYGFSIHKYIFLLLIAGATIILPIEKVMCLIAFVMPLYVGLPGNYLTLVFLMRFLLESGRIRLRASNLLFCVLAGMYALLQAFVTNHMAIAELMLFPGLVLVMLMFAKGVPYNREKLVLCYGMGVAALGLIMLVSTLQVHDLSDLLDVTFRLGAAAVEETNSAIMNVSVDPNFYGTFVISSLALSVPVIGGGALPKQEKLLLIAATGASVAVLLVGLSRAALLVVVLWLLLYILSRNDAKTFLITLLVAVVCVVLVLYFMPDVVSALEDRFRNEDLSTGGGRVALMKEFWLLWWETLPSILFGVGLFDCNVHCAPLQALFGGGLVFFVCLMGYVLTLGGRSRRGGPSVGRLPMFVTVLMLSTVPALTLINFMYPAVFVGLCRKGETV